MTPLNRKRIEEIRDWCTDLNTRPDGPIVGIDYKIIETLTTLALEAERYREALEKINNAKIYVSDVEYDESVENWLDAEQMQVIAEAALQPKDSR